MTKSGHGYGMPESCISETEMVDQRLRAEHEDQNSQDSRRKTNWQVHEEDEMIGH